MRDMNIYSIRSSKYTGGFKMCEAAKRCLKELRKEREKWVSRFPEQKEEEIDDELMIIMALNIATMHYREMNERREKQCTE